MLFVWRNESSRVTSVDLDVVENWLWRAFQEVGQAVIHEFYQALVNGYQDLGTCSVNLRYVVATILVDNVWVSYGTPELTFLFKSLYW